MKASQCDLSHERAESGPRPTDGPVWAATGWQEKMLLEYTLPALAAAAVILSSTSRNAIATGWEKLMDPYRPEHHYMRGPGPKWRAKHQTKQRSCDD